MLNAIVISGWLNIKKKQTIRSFRTIVKRRNVKANHSQKSQAK